MSIASEITRIKGAKASLKSSIEAKGVSVPTNAKIDEYSDYVDDIETGGDISDYIGGTITGNSATTPSTGQVWSTSIKKLPPLANTGTSCSNLFYGFKGDEIDLSLINTTGVTTIKNMFAYCSSLTSLDVSNFDTSNVSNMYGVFSNCPSLTSLDVSNFDTSNVSNMGSMFNNCEKLTSLNLSNFNTSLVTNMQIMFTDCSSLMSLNLSNFNTANVTSMSNMFNGCSSLTSLNLSNFNTSLVTIMNDMFNNCKKLMSLDISSFTFKPITAVNIGSMFAGCTSLMHLDIRGLDFTSITSYSNMFGNSTSNYVPADCEIIVKDNDAKTWINTKFPRMTNVKTVDEFEAE